MNWFYPDEKLPKIGEHVLCECKGRRKYAVCIYREDDPQYYEDENALLKTYFDWDHNGYPMVIRWCYIENYR